MNQKHVEVFAGRSDALALVRGCVIDVRQGRPWVIVVSDSAGSGKSAFVQEVVGSLVDFIVLRAAGDALAKDESMWLVSQLTDSPPGQSAFGVGLSLLATLGERQSQGPVAVVVEDLHWADEGSRKALLTGLRRLEGDHVLAIVTTRPDWRGDDGWERFVQDEKRCRLVELGPLSAVEISRIADKLDVPLGPNAAIRLQRHTDGHALYVRTLLRELTPAQLNAFGALPAPRSLAAATVAQVEGLTSDSVRLLRALAVLARSSPLAVLGSVAGVPDPAAALEGALGSGLIEWEPTTPGLIVRFVHPLYAAAVYDHIPPVRRRQFHLAAAQTHGAASLTHRVAAADRADPALAAELESAALVTSDSALAAHYLSAASDLSATPQDAAVRLLAAGSRHLAAGNVGALTQLQSRLEALTGSVDRDLLLGWLAWQAGDTGLAESLLRGAVERAASEVQSADPLLQLGVMYAFQLRGPEALHAGETVLEMTALDRRQTDLAWRVVAAGTNSTQGGVAACAVLDRAFDVAVDFRSLDPDVKYAYVAFETSAGRPRSALSWVDRVLPDISSGQISWELPHLQMLRTQCHYQLGQWDEAVLHANTGIDLANDEAQQWVAGRLHAVAAWVHAGRGQWESADRRLQYARSAPDRAAQLLTAMADGFLARSRDRPTDVIAALAPLTAAAGTHVPPASNLMFWPALVHAMIDVGDLDAARRELNTLRAAAAARQLEFQMPLLALEARLLAAAGSAHAAAEAFDAAIAAINHDSDKLEQIVLRHAYGRQLRATGRRREAIVQLAAAHTAASRIGAVPYAERIDADLRRWEVKSVPAVLGDPLGTLTSRERDVVTLIARGATNREAAGSLYVSVKAVEYHLGNVYAKLHITSRRQLKDLIAV